MELKEAQALAKGDRVRVRTSVLEYTATVRVAGLIGVNMSLAVTHVDRNDTQFLIQPNDTRSADYHNISKI